MADTTPGTPKVKPISSGGTDSKTDEAAARLLRPKYRSQGSEWPV